MTKEDLERVLRELAQAERDDEALHQQPSTLEERVQSHVRLSWLHAEAARLREDIAVSTPRMRRRDKGDRLFPRGS